MGPRTVVRGNSTPAMCIVKQRGSRRGMFSCKISPNHGLLNQSPEQVCISRYRLVKARINASSRDRPSTDCRPRLGERQTTSTAMDEVGFRISAKVSSSAKDSRTMDSSGYHRPSVYWRHRSPSPGHQPQAYKPSRAKPRSGIGHLHDMEGQESMRALYQMRRDRAPRSTHGIWIILDHAGGWELILPQSVFRSVLRIDPESPASRQRRAGHTSDGPPPPIPIHA